MIFSKIAGNVPGGGCGKDQKRIDDHQADPAHGQGDHNGDGNGEEHLIAPNRNAPGGCQLGMHRGQNQPVGGKDPQNGNKDQNNGKKANLTGGDGENVANEIFVEFGKAAAVHGGNEDTKGHSGGGKDADDRLRGVAALAADVGEQKGKGHSQDNGPDNGQGRAAQHADGNTGKAGVAQSIGEKAHFTRDDHGG